MRYLRTKEGFWLMQLFIAIAAIASIILFLLVSPATSAPDELAHLAYPRTILQSQQLPSFASAFDAWESHQPPLYYLLSLPITSAFSHSHFITQVFAARCLSFILIAAYIFLMFTVAHICFPDSREAKVAMCIFSLFPSVLYTGAAFTNDSLVLCLGAIFLLYAVKQKNASSLRSAIIFGLLVGAGLLSKFSLYPVIAIVAMWVYWKKPWNFIFTSVLTALVSSGWWFLHNIRTAGDIFGLKHTFILWSGQKPVWTLEAIGTFILKFFASSIGIFGKLSIPLPYLLYILWAVVVGTFFVLALRKSSSKNATLALFCICATGIFVVIQSLSFFQPQGRYAFGAFPFMSLFLAHGFVEIKNRRMMQLGTIGGLLILLICSIGASIVSVQRYYHKNPVTQLMPQRHINVLSIPLKGDVKKITLENGFATGIMPFSVYTLADLRILTERNPSIYMHTETFETHCLVRYKRLGDNTFSSEREFTLLLQNGTVQMPFPPMPPTLIQDIQLSCNSSTADAKVIITDFRILTE